MIHVLVLIDIIRAITYTKNRKGFLKRGENMEKKPVTINDVAKEAGVSITTVSRVINKNYPVKESTRIKVEKAIKALDFTPNMLARGLIRNKTYTIGVIVPSIANLFFPTVVKGIEHYMKEHKYTILLSDTEGNAGEEKKVVTTLLERKVDGIIVIDPRKENILSGYYEKITKQIPLVVINGYADNVKCHFVLNDQSMGTHDALNYLMECKHKNIAFLRGRDSYSYDIKEQVYYDIHEKNQQIINRDNILVIEDGNSIETADLSMEAVMERLSKKNPPTAIFACNDTMAVGAMNGIKKMGLKVPQDISVIGYDNTMISELTEPKLTTVDQNMYDLGLRAARRLREVIDNPKEGFLRIVLENNLIKRESVTTL